MSGIASSIYNTVLRSNAIFVASTFVAAFGAQLAFDTSSDKIWDSMNKGRQWKDIKHKYMEAEEEEDDE